MNSTEVALLKKMFQVAVSAAQPERAVAQNLPVPPKGRTVVIGAGKASAEMARVFEAHWSGAREKLSGLVVTRYDYTAKCDCIEIVEAAHPVPDMAGQNAARRILETVSGLSADDLVVCLISGGGSALLSLPADGLTLENKQQINRALLKSGATIREMNCVRKHLSAIKGGRLAAACAPAKLVTLLISDVPDDDLDVIASGPTVADPTTFADALAILDKYQITEPGVAIDHLRNAVSETPRPGDNRLSHTQSTLIATPQMSLEAAANVARASGYQPVILGDSIEGESREVAMVHAGISKQVKRHGQPAAAPCVLLSGGEATVTLKGNGRGGRNAEFALALAVALNARHDIFALAADTDGIDGSEDNAGAIVTPSTLKRGEEAGLSAKLYLENNDAYTFFSAIDDLLMTGPTLTNVNDFRAILIN
ncbi:hydroxypyruvate reductase [Chromatiales bacterium (ex Bugula neritina AB1)]|nr:hydroxypyruvate reductase [Chromatiales bacterium (ex Bugula neritina AB1)]